MTERLDQEAARIDAEAAAWLARLHSNGDPEANRSAFQEWLAESPRHASAFEAMTTVFDAVGGYKGARERATAPSRRGLLAMGGALCASIAVGGLFYSESARAKTYATDIGEQKRVSLSDGTQLLLDTDTRVIVDFHESERNVRVEKGRVSFDITPNRVTPFQVNAAERQIVCEAGSLDVECSKDQLSVFLISGHASVLDNSVSHGAINLADGQRLTIDPMLGPNVDRPNPERMTAWQTGRMEFDNETLTQAAYQMNRYSRTKIMIADPEIAAMRVSGVFKCGDITAFTKSVSKFLPLRSNVTPDGDIILSRR